MQRAVLREVAWPAAATLILLAILVGLGLWQLERREWKLGLIQRIEARAKAPPTDLALAIDEWEGSRDVEYVHAQALGRLLHDKERHLYAPDPRLGPGVDVFTPLQLDGGHVLWVDRGWVPDRLRAPETRAQAQIEGELRVTGLLRAGHDKPRFAAENDPKKNLWVWRDLAGFTASAFSDAKADALPFFMEADAGQSPGGWPRGGVTRITLQNDHLQYALTWLGLAAALLGLSVVFVVRRLRDGGKAEAGKTGCADPGVVP